MDYNILLYNECHGHFNITNTLNNEHGYEAITTDSQSYMINSFVKWVRDKHMKNNNLTFIEVCSLYDMYTSTYTDVMEELNTPSQDIFNVPDREANEKIR